MYLVCILYNSKILTPRKDSSLVPASTSKMVFYSFVSKSNINILLKDFGN